MRLHRLTPVGLLGLVAAPLAAQTPAVETMGDRRPVPGTVEIGAFGQINQHDDTWGLGSSYGAGVRIGPFLTRRWQIEAEATHNRAELEAAPDAPRPANNALALRLNYNVPFGLRTGGVVVGAGASRHQFGDYFDYGPSALVGMRLPLGSRFAARLDGVGTYLLDRDVWDMNVRLGGSMFTSPTGLTAEQQSVGVNRRQPGTVELGGFGQYTQLDDETGFADAWGYGGRIAVFATPQVSIEAEGSLTREGDEGVGVGEARREHTPFTARLNYNMPVGRNMDLILGGGATRSWTSGEVEGRTNGAHGYAANGLAGVRLALGRTLALRGDAVADFYPGNERLNLGYRAGLSLMMGGADPVVPAPYVPSAEVIRERIVERTVYDSGAVARERDARLRAEEEARRLWEAARSTLEMRIYFDFDRHALTPAAREALNAKVAFLRARPDVQIRIDGHTDYIGTTGYNQALGLRRANAARDYLIAQGIDGSRITVQSLGESSPANTGRTAAARAENRRDEFVITIGR